jgi:hypothetical protein
MAKPYDPLPDIAAVIAGTFYTPAYHLPSTTPPAAGRLLDKLGIARPPHEKAFTEVIEMALRAALSPDHENRRPS